MPLVVEIMVVIYVGEQIRIWGNQPRDAPPSTKYKTREERENRKQKQKGRRRNGREEEGKERGKKIRKRDREKVYQARE